MGKTGTKHGERNVYPIKGGTRWAYKWFVYDAKGRKRETSRSFGSKEEAQAFKEAKELELRAYGLKYSLSEDDRQDARRALEFLSGYADMSLVKAAEFFRQHHPLDKSVTVKKAVASYLQYRKPYALCEKGESKSAPVRSFPRFAPKTYSDRAKPTLGQLKHAFGERAVSSLTPETQTMNKDSRGWYTLTRKNVVHFNPQDDKQLNNPFFFSLTKSTRSVK